MRIKLHHILICLGLLATRTAAQDQPLSVIDWVQQNPDQPPLTSAGTPQGTEPPVAPTAVVPDINVTPLGNAPARIIGLVPGAVTGLAQDIWRGSDPHALSAQIADLPDFRLPAAQALMYTLLLTEALGPGTDAEDEDVFTLARVAALQRFGALDPAMALIDQANVTRDAAHFAAYMDIALLTGEEEAACSLQTRLRHLAPSHAHLVFCTARTGDFETAALLFGTGKSLGLMSDDETASLERFLDAEFAEEAPPLPAPQTMTPLLFRLFEALGEPQPTRFLPRAYSVADLRDVAGWKQQLEAAERLTQSGALPPNRLLGLYTEREPAASGSIWDRVEAVQLFDTALKARSDNAVSKTLPSAWAAMQSEGLEVSFATLFSQDLAGLSLEGAARRIAREMALLSPDYQTAGLNAPDVLIAAITQGDLQGIAVDTPLAQAIALGFGPETARADLVAMAREGRRGEAILRALVLLERGASGDPVSLAAALGTLRALDLEDTMRRAAIQILLLRRYQG